MNRIYVTGHRNPDTDSIAAAISYAALRNALGDRDYAAAHLGHISDETKRLLDRFGFQEPVTISNVRTQVRDLDFDTPPALNSSVTMDRAWHIMRDQNISAMPIINEDGTLYGMLSAGDIAAYSMRTISDRHVDALPLFNLLSVIEGRILNDGADQVDRVSGVVTIALPQSCDNLLFSDPDSIILCGNQPDMIRRALDIGVQCIILCQTDVDPAWLENAGKTCVISTPLDASRVARLVYQAIPISRPCNTEDLVSFHLDDYIDDVREVVLESATAATPCSTRTKRSSARSRAITCCVRGASASYSLTTTSWRRPCPGSSRPRSSRSSTTTVWPTFRPRSPSACATSPSAARRPSSPTCIRSTASCRRRTWRV